MVSALDLNSNMQKIPPSLMCKTRDNPEQRLDCKEGKNKHKGSKIQNAQARAKKACTLAELTQASLHSFLLSLSTHKTPGFSLWP